MNKLPHIIFVDGQNIYQSLLQNNFELDFEKFSQFIVRKYRPSYMLWFVKYTKNKFMQTQYQKLRDLGWEIKYSSANKEIFDLNNNSLGSKTNIDADLIIEALEKYYETGEYVLILASGDGDFVPLVRFFEKRNAKTILIAGTENSTSSILINDKLHKIKRGFLYLNQTVFVNKKTTTLVVDGKS